MKKLFAFILGLIFFISIAPFVFATSGTCSWHGGVNCAAGPDFDGSEICNDGWIDSSTLYSQSIMCQSYSKTPTTYEELFADVVIKLLPITLTYLQAQLNYESKIIDSISEYYTNILKLAASEGITQHYIDVAYATKENSKSKIKKNKDIVINKILDVKNQVTDWKNEIIILKPVDTNFIINAHSEAINVIDNLVNSLEEHDADEAIDNFHAMFLQNLKHYTTTTVIQNKTSNITKTQKSDTSITQEKDGLFTDIPVNHKSYQAITYLKENKILQGYPDGSFKPDNTVNRAELMKILIGENLPDGTYENCFKDVKQEWFAPYVCYAKEQGWVTGYSNGTFKPSQVVNRAEAIKMAIAVFGIDLPTSINSNPYKDTDKSSWFASYVQAGKDMGLFGDQWSSFRPSDGMERGDISDIIYKIITTKTDDDQQDDITMDDQPENKYSNPCPIDYPYLNSPLDCQMIKCNVPNSHLTSNGTCECNVGYKEDGSGMRCTLRCFNGAIWDKNTQLCK